MSVIGSGDVKPLSSVMNQIRESRGDDGFYGSVLMRARSRLKTENIPPRTVAINVFGRYVTGNARTQNDVIVYRRIFFLFVVHVTQLYTRVTRSGVAAVVWR